MAFRRTRTRTRSVWISPLLTRFYLLASMYNLQLIRMRIKPNVAKNAPSHRPKFISSNMVSVIFADDLLLPPSFSFNSKLACLFSPLTLSLLYASQIEFCSQWKNKWAKFQNHINVFVCLSSLLICLCVYLLFSFSQSSCCVLFALILCFFSFQFLTCKLNLHVNWCENVCVFVFFTNKKKYIIDSLNWRSTQTKRWR